MRPYQIKRIILLGSVREVPAGQPVMRSGEPSREMYLVLSGRIRLLPPDPGRSGNGDGHLLETGAVFGLVALVCREPRIATALAATDARVLGLDWERIQRLARFYPHTAATFFRNLSGIIGERFRDNLVCAEHGTATAVPPPPDRPLTEPA